MSSRSPLPDSSPSPERKNTPIRTSPDMPYFHSSFIGYASPSRAGDFSLPYTAAVTSSSRSLSPTVGDLSRIGGSRLPRVSSKRRLSSIAVTACSSHLPTAMMKPKLPMLSQRMASEGEIHTPSQPPSSRPRSAAISESVYRSGNNPRRRVVKSSIRPNIGAAHR